MSDYFESRYNYSPPSPEGSSDDDEDEKESRAKRLGKVAGQSTSGKEAGGEQAERRRPSSLNVLFKRDSGREVEPDKPSENSAESEDTNQADAETSPDEDEKISVEALKRAAVRDQAEANLPEAREALEASLEGSSEYAEAEALVALEEGVLAKAENPDIEADEAVEAEYFKRLAELGDEVLEEADPTLPEELPPLLIGHEERADVVEDTETTQNTEGPDETTVTAPAASASTPGSPLPPPPPRPPRSRGTAGPASSGGAGGAVVGGEAPVAPMIELTPPTPEEEQPQPRNRAGGAFLLGALLGHHFGKRRAERKAEAKLERETGQLEDELAKTRKHLEAREKDLKFAAAEKHKERADQAKDLPPLPVAEQPIVVAETQPSPRKPVSEILKQTVETTVAPEKPKRVRPSPAELKRVETTSTPRLLEEAEAIFISGQSVRNMYESNQIDRKGLVEIIQTAMRGGNLKEVIERVELGRERQLERAREFRHDPATLGGGNGQTTDDTPDEPVKESSSLGLPNTPDPSLLAPLSAPSAGDDDYDQITHSEHGPKLEPIDLTKLQRSGTPATTMIGVIVAGIVILLILFLFSL